MEKKYKILNVDDDQQSVIKLSEYINKSKLPYELITVENANQIQETIRDSRIDLIISESKLNGSSIFDIPDSYSFSFPKLHYSTTPLLQSALVSIALPIKRVF